MTTLKCYRAKPEDKCFTLGKNYEVLGVAGEIPYVIDDEGDEHEIDPIADEYLGWGALSSPAEFTELFGSSQNGFEDTQPEYVCTEEEEELFKNIEQKQQPGILAKDHVHIGWTQEETTAPQESVDCSVAVAHHIHELQKWLKHIGCSSETELRITSDHIWVSPEDFVSYEAKEGGVGTLIEYLRLVGAQQKCLEKMEEV